MALNLLSLRNYVEPNVSIGNLSVSTLSGSTVIGTSSGVFPSTLTASTLTGSTIIGSALSGSNLSIYHNGTVSTIGSYATQFAGLHLAPSGTDYSYTGITFGGNTASMDTTQAGIICQSSPFMGTKMIFQTTNSYVNGGFNRMTIDAVGNVGIGTTNPSALLYLNSSTANRITAFYIKSSAAGIVLDSTQETGGKSYNLYTTITGDSSGPGYFRILNITNDTVPFEISPTGQINVAATLAVSGNITSNGVALPITNGSVWGQNGTIIYYTAGVVGIGTASPANSYSSTIPNAKLSILNGIAGQDNGKSRLSIGGDNAHYSAIEGAHTSNGATTLAFMTCTNASINSSNPLTRMFINSTGNIGIGTENPVTSLHIARSVITSNTDFSLMTYYENTYESYHDWAIGPYIHNNAAAFAIRSGSNNLPSGLTNLFFIDGYGTAIQFPAYTTTGTMTMTSGGLITSGSSDRRIKENIIYQTNTSDALSRVLELKPATFKYISGQGTHLGFIAQDVEQFIPEAVDGKKYEWVWEVDSNGNPRFGEDGLPIYRLDKDGNRIIRPRSIDDRALIATQTLAIQELSLLSNLQQHKIISLEFQLTQTQAQLSSLLAWAQAQGFTA